MQDVHPSPSASTGRETLTSSFVQPPDKVDHVIECAQCGMMFDTTKFSHGDVYETDNTAQESGVSQQKISVVGAATKKDQLPYLLQPSYAKYVGTFVHIEPVVTSMCPFCGSGNPKGIGRDHDPFFQSRDFRNAW